MGKTAKDRRINSVLSVVLTIVCILWMYPVFMILMNSLKTERAITTTHAFELPTAFLFPRLLRRFGSGRLLVLSAVFGTLKAVALLCTFNYAGVLLAQPLQLLGYGLFTPASVYFVNESVPEADRVRGQTVMMVASNGMGGMLGGLLAGWTLDMGGANWMLAACIVCGCAGAALCWAALRCPARRTV